MEFKKIQKDIWQNKLNKGFNTTDVNKEFCLLYGEVAEAYDAWKKKKDDSNVISGDINSNHVLINSEYKPNNNYQLCDYCIIQYEMLNLYVDGIISEEELKKMPSLNNNDIIMHIKHIKNDIMDMESVMDNNERGNKEKVLSRNR